MKQTIFLVTALLFSGISNAQVKNEEPTKEEPSRIKVYTPSTNGKSPTTSSYKWAVKTDVFKYLAGEFPVILEYRIAKKISVEASAGLTYAFLPNEFTLSEDDESSSYESKAAMGSAFRAAIKYYPSSDYDAIEGWAFGIQLFTKTSNRDYEVSEDNPNSAALEGKKDTKIKTGISLVIGKQLFQDSNISIESFVGIGFNKVHREYSKDGDYNLGTGSYDVIDVETEKTVPTVQWGLRIGFGN